MPKIKKPYTPDPNMLTAVMIIIFYLADSIKKIRTSEIFFHEIGHAMLSIYLFFETDVNIFADQFFAVFGRHLPTNFISEYMFALPSYMLIPFISVFGYTSMGLKLPGVLSSGLLLFSLYMLVSSFFARSTAVILLLLLAASHNFLISSLTALQITEPFIDSLFFTSILMLALYSRNRKSLYIYFFSFLLGLTFSIKLSTLARIFGFGAAGIIFYNKEILSLYRSLTKKNLLVIFILFSAGAGLFILYNFSPGPSEFASFKKIYTSMFLKGALVDNLDILNNIKLRAMQFSELLYWDLKDSLNLNINILFLSAFVMNILLSLQRRLYIKPLLFVYMSFLVTFLCSAFTMGSLADYHMYLFLPFIYFVYAYFISSFSAYIFEYSFILPSLGQKMKTAITQAGMALSFAFLLFINKAIYASYLNYSAQYTQIAGFISKHDYSYVFTNNLAIPDPLIYFSELIDFKTVELPDLEYLMKEKKGYCL